MALSSQVLAPFAPPDSSGRVALKLSFGGPITKDGIGFQLFPGSFPSSGGGTFAAVGGSPQGLLVFATNGDITKGATYVRTGLQGVVIFGGSDTGNLNFPIDKLTSQSALSTIYDKDGRAVTVTLTVDPDRKVIKASKPIYGSFLVTYDISYTQYYWKHSGINYKGINYKGEIIAAYKGSTATLTVDIDISGEKSNVTEIYRVVSEYVADPDGQWEKPPNFPDDSSYPNGATTEPDQDSFQLLERVHEAGFINTFGKFDYRIFTVRNLQPYESSFSYKPVYTYKPVSSVDAAFQDGFANLDIAAIEDGVRDRWPTAEGL